MGNLDPKTHNFEGRTLERANPACTRLHLRDSRLIHTLNVQIWRAFDKSFQPYE